MNTYPIATYGHANDAGEPHGIFPQSKTYSHNYNGYTNNKSYMLNWAMDGREDGSRNGAFLLQAKPQKYYTRKLFLWKRCLQR